MKCSPRSVQCGERKQSGSLWKTVPISSDGCALAVVLLLYAGCLCHLMQAVSCETDWRRQTVFTYNDSYYGQHRNPPLQGPYQLQAQSYLYINHRNTFVQPRRERVYNYDTRINEVDYYGHGEEETDIEDQPLLVGYSHNPYGNSVKRSEYSRDSPPERAEETSVQLSSGNESRGKRGVIHLYNMISCATGCDPITYKGYGCYCGFLGSGRALDGIDRCCKTHDHCYEDLFCPFFTVYFQPYFWKCHRNQPLCALENYNTRNQFINGCAAKLCECDRQFAMCLQRYPCPRRRAVCRSSPLRLLQNLIMAR